MHTLMAEMAILSDKHFIPSHSYGGCKYVKCDGVAQGVK